MTEANIKLKRNWKKLFSSIDDLFILFGIILNGFSTITSFIYGHKIAGIILLICELILLGIYFMKMI
ncbi:MAG: hypothetical protein KAS63_07715 [Candidatus Heimdallarchaeota archaeon]|nr:hypothetical protein [Candidatus Heimdallarchaeota archaeon]MCK4955236.1 hypothetical protein [Candidatus Heimdallarchaeota archaeon]